MKNIETLNEGNLKMNITIFQWVGMIATFAVALGAIFITDNFVIGIIAGVIWAAGVSLTIAVLNVFREISLTLKRIETKLDKE